MKMLILTDILTLVALAIGTGVLLTAARRSHTNPLLVLFAGLCVEILCATAASEWLRGTEWEPWVRGPGRAVELAAVAYLVRYLLPGNIHQTRTPDAG